MSELSFVVAFLAVTFAATVQGSIGIGFSFIVVPVLAILEPTLIPTTALVLLLPLSLGIAYRERYSVDSAGLKWIIGGRVLGTALAVWALGAISPEQWRPLFGGIIMVMVVLTLTPFRLRLRPSTMAAMGLVSGIFSTLAALGGPPLGVLYSSRQGSELRSTLGLTFALGLAISLIGLAIGGEITTRQLLASIRLAPALVIGFLLSRLLHGRLDRRLQPFILVFAAVVGAVAVVQGIV